MGQTDETGANKYEGLNGFSSLWLTDEDSFSKAAAN